MIYTEQDIERSVIVQTTLTEFLLEKGLGKPYYGEKKELWTKAQLEGILNGN